MHSSAFGTMDRIVLRSFSSAERLSLLTAARYSSMDLGFFVMASQQRPLTLLNRNASSVRSYPPAMAPMMKNGSAPDATFSGSGASGDSRDRSSSQAKKRNIGR